MLLCVCYTGTVLCDCVTQFNRKHFSAQIFRYSAAVSTPIYSEWYDLGFITIFSTVQLRVIVKLDSKESNHRIVESNRIARWLQFWQCWFQTDYTNDEHRVSFITPPAREQNHCQLWFDYHDTHNNANQCPVVIWKSDAVCLNPRWWCNLSSGGPRPEVVLILVASTSLHLCCFFITILLITRRLCLTGVWRLLWWLSRCDKQRNTGLWSQFFLISLIQQAVCVHACVPAAL